MEAIPEHSDQANGVSLKKASFQTMGLFSSFLLSSSLVTKMKITFLWGKTVFWVPFCILSLSFLKFFSLCFHDTILSCYPLLGVFGAHFSVSFAESSSFSSSSNTTTTTTTNNNNSNNNNNNKNHYNQFIKSLLCARHPVPSPLNALAHLIMSTLQDRCYY